MRAVPSLDAERAIARISRTFALHSQLGGIGGSAGGRLSGPSGVVVNDPKLYLVLPHMVAVAEEFSRRSLLALTEPQLPQTSRVLRVLWTKMEHDAEGAWDSHRDAWREWHEVKLTDAPTFINLQAFIEARNAIMHGLGRLTRRQVRKDGGSGVRSQLKSVRIRCVGDQLIVSDVSVSLCKDVARGFVLWLDGAVQRLREP